MREVGEEEGSFKTNKQKALVDKDSKTASQIHH